MDFVFECQCDSEGTRRFLEEFTEPLQLLESVSNGVVNALYSNINVNSMVENGGVKSLKLILREFPGVAHTIGVGAGAKEIHFSANYLNEQAKTNRFRNECLGVLWHEAVHVHQFNGDDTCPSGFIEGIADLIRCRQGLDPPHWRKRWHPPSADASWDDGYERTAHFLLFIEEQSTSPVPDFACRLNLSLKDREWSDSLVLAIAGRTLEDFWKEYCHAFVPQPPPAWCQPFVTIINNAADTTGGRWFNALFENAADAHGKLREIVCQVQEILYDSSGDSPRHIRSLTLFVEDMEGVAYCTGSREDKEIHLSTRHLLNFGHGRGSPDAPSSPDGELFRKEVYGVLCHESVHAFQHNANGTANGGVIEGISDFVRLRAGLGAAHWRRGTKGRKYDSGYEATGFFLDFIDTEKSPGFVRTLNMIMSDQDWQWDESIFETLTGISVSQLWDDYALHCGDRVEPEPPRETAYAVRVEGEGTLEALGLPDQTEAKTLLEKASNRVKRIFWAEGDEPKNSPLSITLCFCEPAVPDFNQMQPPPNETSQDENRLYQVPFPGNVQKHLHPIRLATWCDRAITNAGSHWSIHVSLNHIRQYPPSLLLRQFEGMVVQELAHVWCAWPSESGFPSEQAEFWQTVFGLYARRELGRSVEIDLEVFDQELLSRNIPSVLELPPKTAAVFLRFVESKKSSAFVRRFIKWMHISTETDADPFFVLVGKDFSVLFRDFYTHYEGCSIC